MSGNKFAITRQHVGLAMVLAALAVSLGCVWWWAIRGMDGNIALAWSMTVLAILIVATPLAMP